MSNARTLCLTISSVARLSFLATILALPIIVSGCRPGGAPLSETAFTGGTMGTTYTVKVIDRTGEHSGNRDEIERAIQKRLDAINAAMSTYKEDSEISRFNRAANDEWFPVSESTAEVVAEALRIGEQTDGAFDVTIGPVLRLWHFGAGTSRKKNASVRRKHRECARMYGFLVHFGPPFSPCIEENPVERHPGPFRNRQRLCRRRGGPTSRSERLRGLHGRNRRGSQNQGSQRERRSLANRRRKTGRK